LKTKKIIPLNFGWSYSISLFSFVCLSTLQKYSRVACGKLDIKFVISLLTCSWANSLRYRISTYYTKVSVLIMSNIINHTRASIRSLVGNLLDFLKFKNKGVDTYGLVGTFGHVAKRQVVVSYRTVPYRAVSRAAASGWRQTSRHAGPPVSVSACEKAVPRWSSSHSSSTRARDGRQVGCAGSCSRWSQSKLKGCVTCATSVLPPSPPAVRGSRPLAEDWGPWYGAHVYASRSQRPARKYGASFTAAGARRAVVSCPLIGLQDSCVLELVKRRAPPSCWIRVLILTWRSSISVACSVVLVHTSRGD
jgi:hypothetical protein